MNISHLSGSRFLNFVFSDTRASLMWLFLRVYIGYIWLMAGWAKVISPLWVGPEAGTAVNGFFMGALSKMGGEHPDVSAWYGWFIQNVALPNTEIFSYLVAYGEILVGLGLIVGLFTQVAAFSGMLMNFNFLFAGSVSINPMLIIGEFLLLCAWRTAGWFGLDRYFIKKKLEKRENHAF